MKIPIISPLIRTVLRVVSVCVWLLTVLSAYGGRFNPDFFTIPAVLCLALPYFAILSGILIVFWALQGRFIFAALGVLVLIGCSTPLKDAFPLGSSKKAETGEQTFKIISWNVLHTDDIGEPDYPGNRAAEFMVNSGADVICLVEMNDFSSEELKKASPKLIDSLARAYPFRAGLSTTDIKIMSKYPVDRMELNYLKFISPTDKPRFDFFKVHFPGGKKLIVAMVHLYSYNLSEEERQVVTEINSVSTAKTSVSELKGTIRSKLDNAFYKRSQNAEELRAAINTLRSSIPLIVCGDFNDVPASWAYNIVRGDDMRDAYVETNFGPTWTYNLHMFYFHIDQMLYRGPLRALNLKVGSIDTSDHYPLIGEFAFTDK